MSGIDDKHVLVRAESVIAFTALLILGGLTAYSLVRWNSEVSGSLVLGTVVVFRDVLTKFSEKASQVMPTETKPTDTKGA